MSLSSPMQSLPEEQARLQSAFAFAAARHDRLCPRQVLGVRAGVAGARALGLDLPTRDHRLLTVVETDGCFVDGIEAATGCAVGHRTLRVEDYGRIAATFIDTASGTAFRVAPRPHVRDRAAEYASGEAGHYYAQLTGYQRMPEDVLLSVEPVLLEIDLVAQLGQAGVRVDCDGCGEEIVNGRECVQGGRLLCRACSGSAYYSAISSSPRGDIPAHPSSPRPAAGWSPGNRSTPPMSRFTERLANA